MTFLSYGCCAVLLLCCINVVSPVALDASSVVVASPVAIMSPVVVFPLASPHQNNKKLLFASSSSVVGWEKNHLLCCSPLGMNTLRIYLMPTVLP